MPQISNSLVSELKLQVPQCLFLFPPMQCVNLIEISSCLVDWKVGRVKIFLPFLSFFSVHMQ